MARRKRPGLRYKWSNGTYHTRPEGAAHRSTAKKGDGGKKKTQTPARPPAGTYDPAIDAAVEAAKRGYGDLQADFVRDYGDTGTGGRAANDYQTALAQIALGRTRSTEDRDRALGDVRTGYQRLGRQQSEGARVAGVTSAGLLGRQRAIRAANQAHDEAPIQQAFTRQGQDFDTAQGQLGLNYQRGLTDAQTGLARAGRETNQFGIDSAQTRLYQATQSGWSPPKPRRPRRRRGGKALRFGPQISPRPTTAQWGIG
jgi:hypothetical protein